MQEIQALLPLLNTPKKIFITCHHKPDGDAIGSTLGLRNYLIKKGHDATVVVPSEVPDFLSWMPNVETIINYEAQPEAAQTIIDAADYIFCLDFNNSSRVKTMEEMLRNATGTKVILDHHLAPDTEFFSYGISMPEKSSTCEIVFDYIQHDGGLDLLDETIMPCLYTGTMTDTGSFRFPATTASVHEMIALFKHKGMDHTVIHQAVYDNYSINRLQILGHVLKTMYVDTERGYAIIALDKKTMQAFHCKSGDTEGLVNYPLSVKDIKLSIMLTERDDEVKISFRSKGTIDVASFSSQNFNGGGHFNAAGGSSKLLLEHTINRLKELICTTNLTNI